MADNLDEIFRDGSNLNSQVMTSIDCIVRLNRKYPKSEKVAAALIDQLRECWRAIKGLAVKYPGVEYVDGEREFLLEFAQKYLPKEVHESVYGNSEVAKLL